MKTVTYLRNGRKLRASGVIVYRAPVQGLFKVKPHRDDWAAVWVTDEEIAAGNGKPPPQARKKPVEKKASKPRRTRQPKPAPLPVWKQLVKDVREYEKEYTPESWCPIRLVTVSALANELEAAHARLAEFLPITNAQV